MRPRATLRLLPLLVPLLAALPGCEQVLGINFGSFKKATCSPLSNNCFGRNTCVFNTTNDTFECLPSAGTVPEFFGCGAETDCAAGLACVRFNGNEGSHCLKYCASTADCGADRKCFEFNVKRNLPDGAGTVGACGALSPPCDPLASPSSCASGRCVLLDNDYTFCLASTDTRGPGQQCDDQSQCAEGNNCVGGSNNYFCRQLCLMNGGTCAGGTTCTSFEPRASIGSDEYGFCKPDQ